MSNWIGPLLLLYVIGVTIMSAGCGWAEISRRDKIDRWLRLYFIFGWPTGVFFVLYLQLWDRYERWQLKRTMRQLFTKISGAAPDDATLQRAMERVMKAVDEL